MSQILTPFLLRRLKSDVELKIPPKKEVLVYAPITPLQAKLYRGVLEENVLGMYIHLQLCVCGGWWSKSLIVCRPDLVGDKNKENGRKVVKDEESCGVETGENCPVEGSSKSKRKCTQKTGVLMK